MDDVHRRQLLNVSNQQIRWKVGLSSGTEGKDRVLFRRNRGAVSGGGLEVPILKRCEAFVVDIRTEALQHGFLDDLAAFVDCDFNNLVTRRIG